MLNNLSGVNKSARESCYFSLLIILFCYISPFARQLDLQYNHVGLPFAVFYNPSLIYDNSGVSFGADTRYADKNNHDVRIALTIPAARFVDAGSAFSVGMLYHSDDSYQISTGFGADINYFKFGTSFDIVNYGKIYDDDDEDKKFGLCVNFAFAREMMEYGIVSVVFHNILVDERNGENRRGLTFGLGGALNPYLLLNTRMTGYIDSEYKAKRTETGASFNFYIPQFILNNKFDYSMNAATGFDIIRNSGKKINNKFFMNVGVSLFKKPTLAGALIGVDKNSNYLAVLYNSDKTDYNETLSSNLKFTESDNGQLFFHLECGSRKIESWILNLENGSGKTVRTFSGGNVVPQTIEWNGLDYKGDSVKDQAIRAKLVIQDRRKNVSESETIVIKR